MRRFSGIRAAGAGLLWALAMPAMANPGGATLHDVALCTEVYVFAAQRSGELGNPDAQKIYRQAASVMNGIGTREVGPEDFGRARSAIRPKVKAMSMAQVGQYALKCNEVTAKLAPK